MFVPPGVFAHCICPTPHTSYRDERVRLSDECALGCWYRVLGIIGNRTSEDVTNLLAVIFFFP